MGTCLILRTTNFFEWKPLLSHWSKKNSGQKWYTFASNSCCSTRVIMTAITILRLVCEYVRASNIKFPMLFSKELKKVFWIQKK